MSIEPIGSGRDEKDGMGVTPYIPYNHNQNKTLEAQTGEQKEAAIKIEDAPVKINVTDHNFKSIESYKKDLNRAEATLINSIHTLNSKSQLQRESVRFVEDSFDYSMTEESPEQAAFSKSMGKGKIAMVSEEELDTDGEPKPHYLSNTLVNAYKSHKKDSPKPWDAVSDVDEAR